jgi:NADH-quinone oxidoreductase subunit L
LALKGIYDTVYHKFYIDEVYMFITQNIIFRLISRPLSWFDKHIVDGTVDFVGSTTVVVSGAIKRIQSGHMQLYIWFFVSGALLLVLTMFYLNN